MAPRPAPKPDARAERAIVIAQEEGWLKGFDCEREFATGAATLAPGLDFTMRQNIAASVAAACMARKDHATFTVRLEVGGRRAGIYSTVLGKLSE